VVTIHRDFNTDDPIRLKWILDGLCELSKQLRVVFPMHSRTKKRIQEFGFEDVLEGVDVIQPLDYLKLMGLVMHSAFVITDSGGLQKEAYFCGKRSPVVMPDTDWRELVEVGWNVLVYPVNDTFNVLWESVDAKVIETALVRLWRRKCLRAHS